VNSSFVVLDVKLECAHAVDAQPSLYSFHFHVVVLLEILKLIQMIAESN
jgi:hypothetical protein